MESVKETVKIRVCKGGAWERVDGALEYMPLNCVKRTLILPLLSSYSCLLEAVSERLEIDANSDFMVTYNSDNDIVEVCDDLEVNEFMEFVVKSSRIVTLCIVESSVNGRLSSNSGSNQQSNFIHATPSVNVYQTEYHATQISQTPIPVFPGSGGFYQNVPSYQQMHGFFENPVYVPGFLGYPMHDPQSDSANRKNKQVVGSPKHKKPSVLGKVKRLSGEDESSESDDESSESDEEGSESDEDEETTPVENKNCKVDKFWNMPPLLKTPPYSKRLVPRYEIKKGTPQESFSELPLYCHNLKLKNQGTITHIETDDEDRFEIFFSCHRCCDGAHLKGEFLGTMYLAVAMDGNNQILPLAYGVGKSETFRSWDWFLTKLKECIIGKQDHLTIISDGACPRFISKEELFWKACKAYRISDFEERFSTLRDWLPSIANKLDMIGLEKWARKLSKCRTTICRNLANVGQQMANLKASQKSGKIPGGHTFHGYDAKLKTNEECCNPGFIDFASPLLDSRKGWRRQEILSRLLPHVTDECVTRLTQVISTFEEGKLSFEKYVLALRDTVGIQLLVKAIAIGKEKWDLTAKDKKPYKYTKISKVQSLKTEEIVNILNDLTGLTKANLSEVFWDGVWPRLKAKGWHNEQPTNYTSQKSKNSLVFLPPGVAKFSRRSLEKGSQYFDSLTEVLNKFADSAVEMNHKAVEIHGVADSADCESSDGNNGQPVRNQKLVLKQKQKQHDDSDTSNEKVSGEDKSMEDARPKKKCCVLLIDLNIPLVDPVSDTDNSLFHTKDELERERYEHVAMDLIRTSTLFFLTANAVTTSNIDLSQRCNPTRELRTMLPHECKNLRRK
ncbi:zinc finger, CCHC-type containing protein [Tanacetum coccineum]